ncbi:MAG: hypothetical protein A07HB70_00279 [uncultured archaeon A07HB70]|jgi:hypothetical protein|nr:MAG: hypothetical protein A07HB70_00279 [uncultured archaeon A07HB70]
MGVLPDSLTNKISDRPTASAVVAYAVICVPVYFLLVSETFLGLVHEEAGTTGTMIPVAALIMGSLMFVPALHLRFKQQYGGGQARRLGFTGGSNE